MTSRSRRRAKTAGQEDGLSIIEHLEELRRRLIWVVVAVAVGTVIGWLLSGRILEHLIRPVGQTVFLAPGEAFHTHLRVAFIAGLLLAFPVAAAQLGAFVWPALYRHERRYVLLFVPLAVALFVAGVSFAYFVMLPFLFRFFLGFGSEGIRPTISISSYVSFVSGLLLPAGILFQLPVAVILLARLGLVTPVFLRRNRKFALLAIFVLAAFLTPPDVVSQVILAGPLIGLYELSIALSVLGYRARGSARDESD